MKTSVINKVSYTQYQIVTLNNIHWYNKYCLRYLNFIEIGKDKVMHVYIENKKKISLNPEFIVIKRINQ